MTSKRKPPAWIANDPDAVRLWKKGYREEQKRKAGKRKHKGGPTVKYVPYAQGKEDV